jgi:hypothetical protein
MLLTLEKNYKAVLLTNRELSQEAKEYAPS